MTIDSDVKKIVLNIIMAHGYPASEGCEEKSHFQILRKEITNGLLLVTRMMIAIVIIKSKINRRNATERIIFIILSPVQKFMNIFTLVKKEKSLHMIPSNFFISKIPQLMTVSSKVMLLI